MLFSVLVSPGPATLCLTLSGECAVAFCGGGWGASQPLLGEDGSGPPAASLTDFPPILLVCHPFLRPDLQSYAAPLAHELSRGL